MKKEIPGRWRRHCPNGPIMSPPGCNLVDDGSSDESGNAVASGKCVCGPSVPWCPGEPRPYDYRTRHECKLNLAAKIAYGREKHKYPRKIYPTSKSTTSLDCLPCFYQRFYNIYNYE
ncbi:hypothetical protein M0802_015467 [Mischocyttarus mexicanus]|nr:hypothetical protein M0802_015467 [Mischocyttarus mexicanus]